MKLELKHLASYLPYGLKGFCTDDLQGVEIMNGLQKISDNCIEVITDKEPMDLIFFKPILLPLSSLSKEISINNESFIPSNKLGWEYCSGGEFGQITYCEYGENPKTAINVLEYIDDYFKLLEWKIDVFGLIDAGLAEPVTEDFNPYK